MSKSTSLGGNLCQVSHSAVFSHTVSKTQPRSLVHGRFLRPTTNTNSTPCPLILLLNASYASTYTMEEKSGQFEDFDNVDVYNRSKARALRESTRNFVVEFGKDEAQIAFDMSADHIRAMLDVPRETERPPVRWMYVASSSY